ncbi:MAG: RHS repeat-associated core domain-containing protein [Chitinophagales bacterium]|nr:hypothetical protein [Bacteroidota bacterium]MBK8488158.1 hypothetical protein [Bacteroidota bacterium]
MNPSIASPSSLYPFGMLTPGRNWSAGSDGGYRFRFNGQESDDEIKGSNNCLDFGARIYDSRLCRFLSIDPRFSDYSWQTPYAYYSNNPIKNVDVKGEGGPGNEMSTPDGGTITLPDGATGYTLGTEQDCIDVCFADGTIFGVNVTSGSLKSFEIDGSFYDARWDKSGNFTGYAEQPSWGENNFTVAKITYDHSTITNSNLVWSPNDGSTSLEAGATVATFGGDLPPSVIAGIVTSGVVYTLSSIAIASDIHHLDMQRPSMDFGGIFQSNKTEKTLNDLIPGGIKASPSWHDPYGELTPPEIENLAKQGDKKAKNMQKLLRNQERLSEKNKNKRRK